MALDWNVGKVKNYEAECFVKNDGLGRRLNATSSAIVWGTMLIGMDSITEKNVETACDRFAIYQELHGPLLVGPDGEKRVTDDDVRRHVGVETNVSNEGDRAWRKRMLDIVWKNAEREVKRQRKLDAVEREAAR